MIKVVDAVFDGNVLHLEEPINLKPNTRVRITIETIKPIEAQSPSFLRTARSLNLQGPSDWSDRFEDYLYGRETDVND